MKKKINDPENTKTFRNPVLPGSFPDPSICRAGGGYYMAHSTFEYFPGVPISHSKDLVNWKIIGHCLDRESQLPLEGIRASAGIFAPSLRYSDGIFYMVTTNVKGGGNFYVTAKNPAGPWSEPVFVDNEGMDPSLFFDDDGKAYYIRHVGEADGYIGQSEIDIKTGKLKGELKKIWGGTGGIWAEGPHMYKINGLYYLLISEGGTSYDHCVTVARSDSPWGPFESNPDNPILGHSHLPEHPIQAVGHCDLAQTPGGWYLVCLAIRPQGGRFHHMGRETFLAPVEFNSRGWPVVNGKGTIEFEMPLPQLQPCPWPQPPALENFDCKNLAPEWSYIRNPNNADYSLTERPGYLRLKGSEKTLIEQSSPTFVGRRQTALSCKVSAVLEFSPQSENEEAGLTVRQTDKFHFDLGLTLRGGKRQVFFRKILRGGPAKAVNYVTVPEGPIILEIETEPLTYKFSCSFTDGKKMELGSAGTKEISVEEIGFEDGMCFTGAYFGMYASGNGRRVSAPADFDWFELDDYPMKG